ncbi:MAG: hypothetical protein PVH55_10650 [Desulfobacterales bacterium]|jgi:hypothetical protein
MASNFIILFRETKDGLHLNLTGDFDENAAHELVNTLKEYGSEFYQIFIDTNDLTSIHPYGRYVFQKDLSYFNKKISNLIFIGENEYNIAK